MTKDEKFQIGMVLNYIATSLSDEDFQEVKGFLKDIEKMIAEQIKPKSCDNCEYEDLESSEGACDTCEDVKGEPTNWTPKQTEPSADAPQTDCGWK